ncbi:MAG: beta-carotene hydroxylase [Actinomycetota bacterium]|nr:beta-carotene hydroxylase [Actinomycetota bacterium]
MKFLLIIATFFIMEPVAYLAHRLIMHGVGWALHRSHHSVTLKRIEANDAYPVIFAAITIAAMAIGTSNGSLSYLLYVGIGITAYGAVYSFIHDVYIHGRFFTVPKVSILERLKFDHQIHHLYGKEPFGMIFPFVPKDVRARALAVLASNRQMGFDELIPGWSAKGSYLEV